MTGPREEFDWTEAAVARLRGLWAEGHPSAEIGRRMGITKNAVVAKAHRLGLSGRDSPIKRALGADGGPVVLTAFQVAVRHRLAEGGHAPLPPFHPIAAAVLREAKWRSWA